MLGAMDVFVFPSLHEGLPLVLVEAQAAGLPSVISDAISEEAIIAPKLVKSLSLQDNPATWAEAVIDSANSRELSSESEERISQSKFNAIRSAVELCEVYLQKNKKEDSLIYGNKYKI